MFRINAFEIHLPPLRERIEDVPALATHLLARFRPVLRGGAAAFTEEAVELLKSHAWPGNVRELANVVEHATILCDELPIQAEHLPANFLHRRLRAPLKSLGPMTLAELEIQAIHESLERNENNKTRAAEELGISLKTLYNRLNQVATLDRTA
jgi:two-component system NtrC family response regulator